jgi:Amidases related to nicotinamidase
MRGERNFYMNKTALVVIDVQNALVEAHPYNEGVMIDNLKRLIEIARKKGIEVIFVRHDGGAGDELEFNTAGWRIYSEIEPYDGEKIIDKRFNSSFRNTEMKAYLDANNVKTLIIAGLQTEYCVDTTVKVAFEYGYDIIIPKESNSTFDNNKMTGEEIYDYYNFKIWDKRFGRVLSVDEVEDLLSE